MYSLKEIDELVARAGKEMLYSREPYNLYEPVEYTMSIGGKRVRPKLCLTVYNLFSDRIDSSVLSPAFALEMFHEFTLLHDDIMDKAPTRRGRPTVYKKWNENAAILSGDAMAFLSYKYLAKAKKDKLPKVLDLFTTTAISICEGQQLDMDFEQIPLITMDDYLRMIGLKTACLLAASARMGALLGGCGEELCRVIYDYGYQLGLAFQIADDYLDTFGDEKSFGKQIGGDIACNKKTWLLVSAIKKADRVQRAELERIMKMDSTSCRQEKFFAMKDMYLRLGIKDDAENTIARYHNLAVQALEESSLTSEQKARLDEFAKMLLGREK